MTEDTTLVVDRAKLAAALEPLGDAAPKIDSLAPEKSPKPKWYTFDAWNRATLNFADFAPGVTVVLKDCSAKDGAAIVMQNPLTPEGFLRFTIDGQAALAKGHLASITGDFGAIFNANHPATGAPIAAWKAWIEALSEKVAFRLALGIVFFRGDEAKLGNE